MKIEIPESLVVAAAKERIHEGAVQQELLAAIRAAAARQGPELCRGSEWYTCPHRVSRRGELCGSCALAEAQAAARRLANQPLAGTIAAAPIGLELAEAVLAAAADVFTPTKVLYLAHEFLAAAKGGKP